MPEPRLDVVEISRDVPAPPLPVARALSDRPVRSLDLDEEPGPFEAAFLYLAAVFVDVGKTSRRATASFLYVEEKLS